MLPTIGTNQYDWLMVSNAKDHHNVELRTTKHSQIVKIENAVFLNASEKLQVLLVLTHHIFTGEIALQPDKEQREKLLKHLKLPYFINSYNHSRKGLLKWFQVSANTQINQFVKKHTKTMSPMEAGLLYRYPTTAILAYMNLIPRQNKFIPTTPADYFFGMVHSRDWLKQERMHYEQIFKKIQKISPKVAEELTASYQKKLTTHV